MLISFELWCRTFLDVGQKTPAKRGASGSQLVIKRGQEDRHTDPSVIRRPHDPAGRAVKGS